MTVSSNTHYSITEFPTYNLVIQQKKTCCNLHMTMKIPCINTRELPHTFAILKRELPSILNTTCFNEFDIPFREEVKHTEMGHLFEHILLEYLCLNKLADGHNKAVYNGNTSWNWVKEKRGLFHIVVDVPVSDQKYLKAALHQTHTLMSKLLLPLSSEN